MIKTVFFLTIFLLLTNAAFGCSIVTDLPVSDNPIIVKGKSLFPAPKPAQYVFIGEVVEIINVAKPKSDENRTNAEGLKVKVTENIYSPQTTSYYEILPLRIYPDCSLQGETGLKRTFPIGSKVRVIAHEATIYKKLSDENFVPRLETSIKNNGSIVRNDLNENTKSSADSFYDYSSFALKKPTTQIEETEFYSKLESLKFELQKDLARLVKAKTESERIKVMERLVYYPYFYRVPFHTLAAAYLKKSKKRQVLEAKWEERKQQQIQQNKQASSQ